MSILAALVLALFALAPAVPDNAHSLFADTSRLELRIELPFARLFADARKKPSGAVGVDAVLSYQDRASGQRVTVSGVRIAVRGNSSRHDSECTFPKLRIDLSQATAPAGSLFAGIRSLKIGTHCGDRPDGHLTRLGRWANDKAPAREALVYRLVAAAGVPTLRARPATITYVDGAATALTRGAMLLEDEHDAIERLGGQNTLKRFTSASDDFAVNDAAALAFAEAMIGNFDWGLKFSPDDYYRIDDSHPLWNVVAVRRADGSAFPLINDFDLSGIVTGSHRWFERVYFDGVLASRSHRAIEVIGQVQRTRTLFPRDVLDGTRQRFLRRRGEISHTIDAAAVDPDGRRFAREYVEAFFDAIRDDEAFYRPVVVESDIIPHASADGEAAACGVGDRVPVGTVVGAALERSGRRVRVPLLDVWWHWASRCDAVHEGAVWIDASAIGRDFPR